jgi:uncharacterized membrane protein
VLSAIPAILLGAWDMLSLQKAATTSKAKENAITLAYMHAAVMDLVVLSSAWSWWDRRDGKGVPDETHLIVALNGFVGMIGAGYLGGQMVYEHGVGVNIDDASVSEEKKEQ